MIRAQREKRRRYKVPEGFKPGDLEGRKYSEWSVWGSMVIGVVVARSEGEARGLFHQGTGGMSIVDLYHIGSDGYYII